MTLSDYIYNYRKQHGLSQRAMSEKCGLSNAYICYVENRTTRKGEKPVPSMNILLKLAKGMGITLDELIQSVDELSVNYADQKPDIEGSHRKQKEYVADWLRNEALPTELVEFIQIAAERLNK